MMHLEFLCDEAFGSLSGSSSPNFLLGEKGRFNLEFTIKPKIFLWADVF